MGRFDEMTGEVEILGDPAQQVTQADKDFVNFTQKGYRIADKIWMGIGAGVALAAGITTAYNAQVNNPFKPYRLCWPSEYAVDVYLEDLSYGSTTMLDGDALAMAPFTEAANRGDVSLPTIQTAMPVSMRIRNSSGDEINVAMQLNGFRLRQ